MYRILYVDDEPGLLDLGVSFLELESDFHVDSALSAEDALQTLPIPSYDAIVSDYQMADLDGIGFLKKVRERYGRIPFILFTGRGREEVVIEAINASVDFYLQKGGDTNAQFAELAHKIRHAIRRRRAELEKDQSEEKFFKLFLTSPSLEAIADAKTGILVDVNDACVKTTGYSRDELIGRHFLDPAIFTNSIERGKFFSDLERNGIVYNFQTTIQTKNGHDRIIVLTSQKIRVGDDEFLFTQAVDITDSRSRRMLAQAMDLAQLVNWEFDVATKTFMFDDRFYALYGTSAEREGGTVMSVEKYGKEFVHPDDIHVMSDVARDIQSPHPSHVSMFEHRIIRRDGEVRHIVVRIAITKDEQGRTVKTHGANQDITDRKRMEESLRQANRKLGLLTGITRHDIKNQLFALKAFLSIASEKTSDAATVRDSLVNAVQAADIIEEQIAFTKEYELIGSENPIWQNPSAVLDATLREVHMDGVVITNSLDPGLEVYSDPMLRKVLFNLLDNALRHGERVSKIQVSARSHGDDLLIVWEDNGVGIAQDDKDLIFERGFGKNSGLGMFLAREILSLTGITIRETGEPGRGARFEIRVPRGVHRTAGRA